MITSSLELIPVFAYGHSQVAETGQGRTISASYVDRIRTRLNMGDYSNRGSASYQSNDMAMLALGNTTKKWIPTTASVVFIDIGIVDMFGAPDSPKKRNSFKNGLVHIIHTLGHASKINDVTQFTRSGSGWIAPVNSNLYSNGSRSGTTISGSYCVVPFSGDKVTLTLIGIDDDNTSPGGAKVLIENESGSCSMLPMIVDTANQSSKNNSSGNVVCPMAIPLSGFGSGSHSVRMTHITSSGKFMWVDDAMIPGRYPPTIIVKKMLYVTASFYDAYTSDSTVDDYNDIIVNTCASYSNVVVVSSSNFNLSTMLHADGGHYNDIGSNCQATDIIEQIKDLPYRSGQNTIIS